MLGEAWHSVFDIDLVYLDNFILYIRFGEAPLFTFFICDGIISADIIPCRAKRTMSERHGMILIDTISAPGGKRQNTEGDHAVFQYGGRVQAGDSLYGTA